jgi:DnaJ-domain-containing protein 1
LSRPNAAAEFAAAFLSALSSNSKANHSNREIPPTDPPKQSTAGLAAALSILGLSPEASFEAAASAAYRSPALQNHPDKVAHMAPEFWELAERKMRELNAAFEQIRNFYHSR